MLVQLLWKHHLKDLSSMHATHKFTSLHFLCLSKFSFFKVYSYLSIVHICIFFLWNLQAKIFLKGVFLLSLSLFSISKSVFYIWISLAYCSATKYYPLSIQWIGKGPFKRGNLPSVLSSVPEFIKGSFSAWKQAENAHFWKWAFSPRDKRGSET